MGATTPAQQYLKEQLLALESETEWGGDYANKPGYHATRKDNQKNWPNDYSIQDPPDLGGPGDKCAAYDWTFPDAQAGRYDLIMKYSKRLLASGQDPNDFRLDGWREFYGQADKDTHVEGWDFRYVGPVTSDSSHLWHIHLSENRDQVESYENKDKLLSVLRGQTVEEYMTTAEDVWKYKITSDAVPMTNKEAQNWVKGGEAANRKLGNFPTDGNPESDTVEKRLTALKETVDAIKVAVDSIQTGGVDEEVLAQRTAQLVVQQLGGLVYKPEVV